MAGVICEHGGIHVLISQRPVLNEEVVSDTRSRFIIEPLEP
jgi:DNA-directed RNA polymerase subunit alpha